MYQIDTNRYITFTLFTGVNTTQRLEEKTLDRLREKGKMGDSFNVVLNRLLDKIDDLEEQLDDHRENIDELVDDEDEPED